MNTTRSPRTHRSRALRIVLLVAVFGTLSFQLVELRNALPLYDFIEYWSAGKLALSGANPYSQPAMFEFQRSISPSIPRPIMMWNPPFALPITLPFSLLPFGLAHMAWFLFLTCLFAISADWLWRIYGGDRRKRWIAWIAGATFMNAMSCLQMCQISPLILFGMVAFLYFERKGMPVLAGVATVLLAFKPHLLYLFWIALALYVIQSRKWRIIAGTAVGFAVMTGIALLVDPLILREYFAVWRNKETMVFVSSFGGILRWVFGEERYWLQFLPSFFGLMWFVPYWISRAERWEWTSTMPLVSLVSVMTASYGWSYDQVVLLPALIHGAVLWRERLALPPKVIILATYIIAQVAVFLLSRAKVNELAYLWSVPLWLAMYVWIKAQASRKPAAALAAVAQ